MKLIIQIPCYNEEATLGLTLSQLPRQLPGIDQVEWLIINDGSIDATVEVAKASGVDHIVSFDYNRGLAKAFMAGLEAGLKAGADIIVNTDADNQYSAADIPKLIEPILQGEAEIVIGARPIEEIEHFSAVKKLLQNWEVRWCVLPAKPIFLMPLVVFAPLAAMPLFNAMFLTNIPTR